MKKTPEELKNKVIKLKKETPLIGGEEILIEDTCEKVFESPTWLFDFGNPAIYQFTLTHKYKPAQQCYYGKVGGLGYIVREDEFEE